MSLVVDELESAVVEALPGTNAENADYLRELIDRLEVRASDYDADAAAEEWFCPGCGTGPLDPGSDVIGHVRDCEKMDGTGRAVQA